MAVKIISFFLALCGNLLPQKEAPGGVVTASAGVSVGPLRVTPVKAEWWRPYSCLNDSIKHQDETLSTGGDGFVSCRLLYTKNLD